MPIPSPADLFRKIFPVSRDKDKTPKKTDGSIGLYGLSKAGKTVFLSVLFREAVADARASRRFSLRTRHQETLREMLRNRDLLEGRSELGRPAFPPPTITQKLYHFDAILNRKHLYPFRTMDYKGEGLDWTRTSGSEETIEFLSGCDCLLFLYEPDEEMLNRGTDDVDILEPARFNRLQQFNTMIAKLRKDQGVKLNMPIALVITKADLLDGFDMISEQDTVLLGRQLLHAKFNDPETFIRRVLDQPHIKAHPPWARQVRKVLTALTLFWEEALHSAPTFQVFFVSATGGTEELKNERGEKEVVPPARLRPKGVLPPFFWVVDMVMTLRQVRILNRIAWRWLLPITFVLNLGIFYLNYTTLDTFLRDQVAQAEDAIRKGKFDGKGEFIRRNLKMQIFYRPLYNRWMTMDGAARIRTDLLKLAAYGDETNLPEIAKADESTRAASRLKTNIESELPKLKSDTPGLAADVEQTLASLDDELKQAIKATIRGNASKWGPEKAAVYIQTFVRQYAISPGFEEDALRYYDDFVSGKIRDDLDNQVRQITLMAMGNDVTRRDPLTTNLDTFVQKAATAGPTYAAQVEKVRNWQTMLSRVDNMSSQEAALHRADFPLLKALVDFRLENGEAGGPGSGGGVDGPSGGGSDAAYTELLDYLGEIDSSPSTYYSAGLQKARDYLRRTNGREEPSIAQNRAAANRWINAVDRWTRSGLDVHIRVARNIPFQGYYEIVGEGDAPQVNGPFNPGAEVKVKWQLETTTQGPGRLRLYFSPLGKAPQPSEYELLLREPYTVRVGVAELLEGRPVMVGSAATPVTIEITDRSGLPRLAANQPPHR